MKKKFFLAGLLATAFLTSGVIPIVKTAASEAYAYPLTFDSANDLNAFDCYYSEGGAKGILCDAEELSLMTTEGTTELFAAIRKRIF